MAWEPPPADAPWWPVNAHVQDLAPADADMPAAPDPLERIAVALEQLAKTADRIAGTLEYAYERGWG